MTSKLKVNILADGGDNAIMTSDGSGSLTLNNAALKNTPAFNVRMNTLQSISNETDTLVAFDTEIYDTDSAFDNTARRLKGEKVNCLNLENSNQKNPVKRIIGKLINRS